jgi:hypothetical protein
MQPGQRRPKPAQDTRGRIISANIGGPGRPKGSRNKLGEDFIDAIYVHWQAHGRRKRRRSTADIDLHDFVERHVIGCRLIFEGLAALDALGVRYFHQFFLLLLAHGQLRSDKLDGALDTLDRAEALNRSGQKWCEAEVHRLRGEVLLARSADDDAENAYQGALELARSQDAKLWEIRAATSLDRLWRDQGKRDEARDLLAPVYHWFTEGLDTPDLVDAKSLLDQLQ